MKKIIKTLFIFLLIITPFSSFAQDDATKLTMAIMKGDVTQVKELLASGVSADIRTSGRVYALQTAVQFDNFEIAKILIENGANVNRTDAYKRPIIFAALNAKMMKLLIDSGADINAIHMGLTPLESFSQRLVTTESDKSKTIAAIKKQGFKGAMYENAINAAKKQWLTKQNIIDVVNLYDQYGYNPVALRGRKEKESALYRAAISGNFEFVQAVIDLNKYEFNEYIAPHKTTILSILTSNTTRSDAEYDLLVTSLIKHGAEVDQMVDSPKRDELITPLMLAAQDNNLKKCSTLVNNGASVTVKNQNGRAPIMFTLSLSVLKLLESKGGDIFTRDNWNQTLLFWKDQTDIQSYLISKGIKIDDEDKDGETALFTVDKPQAVEFLLSKGANVNHINKSGESIVQIDARNLQTAMRHDYDRQDEFVAKFKVLAKYKIDKERVAKALEFLNSSGYEFEKAKKVLELYIK